MPAQTDAICSRSSVENNHFGDHLEDDRLIVVKVEGRHTGQVLRIEGFAMSREIKVIIVHALRFDCLPNGADRDTLSKSAY